jgi:hypothetical protein
MQNYKYEHYLTGAAIVAWIILFSAGLVVSSKPYLDQLQQSFSFGGFFIAMLVYTPSNTALLSILSGFIGGCISRLIAVDEIKHKITQAEATSDSNRLFNLKRREAFLTESPVMSMFRGFLTYVAVISGLLLLISNPFEVTSPQQYIRVAGLISGLAFIMGYDPTRFEELIANLSQWKTNS